MKSINSLFQVLLILSMAWSLVSCNAQLDDIASESEIKLTSKLTDAAEVNSRVNALDYQSTKIIAGQQVGVTITGAKSEHNNVAWTVASDGTLNNNATPIYWANTPANISAYHPFKSDWTGNSHTFSVSTDQSTEVGYRNSDLLWASKTASKADGMVTLNFVHKLAKINVTLSSDDVADLSGAIISICGSKTSTNFNPITGELSGANTIAEIKAGVTTSTAYTASAIIVPQTIPAGTQFIKVNFGEKEFNYKLESDKEFLAGYRYNCKVNLKDGSIFFELESGNITDWGTTNDIVKDAEDGKELLLTTTTSVKPTQDSNGVFLIKSACHMKWFMENCKNTSEFDYRSASYKLETDIVLEVGWEPIYSFSGTFDGGNHVIENLRPGGYEYGRWGFIANLSGTVKNLIFKNPSISQSGDNDYYNLYLGVLAADGFGTIINCGVVGGSISVYSSSRATAHAGGLIGYNNGNTIMKGCFVVGTKITTGGTWSDKSNIGGLIGSFGSYYSHAITSCYTKDLTISGSDYGRSFIGSSSSVGNATISNCFYDASYAASGLTINGLEPLTEENFADAITQMNTSLTDCDYKFDGNGMFIKR